MHAADRFAHSGSRPHTSPAREVIDDFKAQGISVDQLYVMLEGMQATVCMEILEPHGERLLLATHSVS